ncbi:glycosyltransferase [Spirosoma sp. KCTC 42546]|uniref:glycosyltransferase n=1 Tax=Spirosoma sp. KCTC 42546 TaxID=2520506 RepID=UPI00115C08CD|nr:glycosyltransferase [Spirosoma sp. KCTC 42546]QDK80120.1 glycosyltransferase [Spirosoma sp. KCTC 42546]
MPAPIVLFAYKRASELQRTVTALQANYLADQSELYVFVDGPRPGRADELAKVDAVRAVLDNLTGFRRIHRLYREQNMGCANSIIAGVTAVLQTHPSVIVLEDDIVTSRNFLDYMNQCLERYADTPTVFSIGGYTFPFPRPQGYESDVYFFGRTCAWGWGIWADRWEQVDWALRDFDTFITDESACKAFNANGQDRVRMLKRAYTKEIDAWDIRLCYSEFKWGGVTVYPTISKTINIGIDSVDSTTEVVYNRYKTVLDNSLPRRLQLPADVSVNPAYARRFRRKFSVPVRMWNKLKTFLLASRLAIGKRAGVGKPVEQ